MQKSVYYVYEWYIIETDEVFYIGKGKKRRAWQLKENKFFMDIYNTHKCDVRIIYDGLSEKEAFEKEIELIKYYRENTDNRLTNIADGGNQPPIHYGDDSPTKRIDVRNKISKSSKSLWKNEEFRKRVIASRIKYCNLNKDKLRISSKKRFSNNPNLKHQIKETNIKTWNDCELRKNHSEIMKKCYNNEKAIDSTKKAIFQIDNNGNIVNKFISLMEAEKKTGIKFKNISKVLRGTNKSAGGYKWKYAN